MTHPRKSGFIGGLVFVLVGLLVLGIQLLPGIDVQFGWPWIILGLGLLLLFIGSATGVAVLAIPATLLAGIGGILYYQTVTGDWDSWAYIWSLIPGFVGLGVVLLALMDGYGTGLARVGGWLISVSLGLFALVGSVFGALGFLGDYWPGLLILLGLVILISPLLLPRG